MAIKRLCIIVFASVASLVPRPGSAERLVYSVYSNAVVDSFPGAWKASTSIMAWDPKSKKTATVFSDRDIRIVLLVSYGSGFYQHGVVVPARSSLFAVAAERKADVTGAAVNRVGSIYELTVDGSNRARSIAAIQSEVPLSLLAVSADGNKLAYVGYEKQQGGFAKSLVVIDRAGRTLAKTDLRGFSDDCRVPWLGWSEDGKTLRWVLAADGDEHTSTEAGLKRAGNYVTRWDGTMPRRQRSGFQHDVASSPSGRMSAFRRGKSPQPGYMKTGEVWVRDNAARVETRIASVEPVGSIRQGIGAENHFLSLLGWLKE